MKGVSFAIMLFVASLLPCFSASGGSLPEEPKVSVDTAMPETIATRTICRSGCDYGNGQFQLALDEAKPGTTLVLEAGATYTGRFVVRKKAGSGWIVIQSSALPRLPTEGNRVSPGDAVNMPKLVSPNSEPAVDFELGAHHYRFAGIEITGKLKTTSRTVYDLVRLGFDPSTGRAAQSPASLPNHIVFDRCFIHGNPAGNYKRGIAMNTGTAAVVNSHISDIHVVGQETQAIAGWNATGPWKIENNHLEAAGINLLAGGAIASSADMIVSDVMIRRNHFFKPLSWKSDDPSYCGIHWEAKNLLEIKHGRRFLIDGNVFENSWSDAQEGWAVRIVLFGDPHDTVTDIAFTNNIVRHAANGLDVCGACSGVPLIPVSRVLIKNNILADISASPWSSYPGAGWALMLRENARDITVDHNDLFQSGTILLMSGTPGSGLVFTNNITLHNSYGIFGDGVGVGNKALETYYPGYIFRRNIIAAIPANLSLSSYPPDNFFPISLQQLGFKNLAGGNLRLADESPYRDVATDGSSVGADIDALIAATAFSATPVFGGFTVLSSGERNRP